ncbi:bifunctional DNA-formamidopyrimidine glycosylase/DNA-(apurinic or apyrimidinic site) lyase [Aeromicrobium tamlense]|uniref:Formamidopyrimidine-DNA glycosylase n=1 Tax=Aeromicrobium tamlense TaxID=375541 RepID=A0A8I0FWD9_9ACTN|nr:bifunctional DNA-formamidopyrimidine glycosylase/DNA-(apurinic or apyrimidinic site) lyase [Aeromicrobium tamlense]MBD1268669.1 bifunctional DNA-formamidopyrimidine glycosylase/DNA-(apurinic or apyrimidinic site) lyase [Aeromicrobium tamlense]NYI37425.1 formamidopyrimidine-DNA glycosylase [Aeromicrobium tamlense]
MPELPEVEVVRRGLDDHVVGRTLTAVEVLDARSVRRHGPGPSDFVARLTGRHVTAAHRRGKYLWMSLDDGSSVLTHLGMSGQALICDPDAPPPRHLRITFDLDDGRQLRFADQRIFGGMAVSETDPPTEIAHIALDPLDPDFDDAAFVARLRRRQTGVKRALLDQGLVSGVGNIYADEALWRSRLHYARNTKGLRIAEVTDLIGHVRDVMAEALEQGGTSFDALYVNVNGQSGYFDRSLHAYGQEGRPCDRCGSIIVREPFMNRSSYRCPTCQPRPRNGRW